MLRFSVYGKNLQIGADQVCVAEHRVREVGSGEVRPLQRGIEELDVREDRAVHVHVRQVDVAVVATAVRTARLDRVAA